MEIVDGRQYANYKDLMAHTGYSRDPLSRLWGAREDNGHPEPRTIGGVMHWDLEEWDAWFAKYNRARRDQARPIDRSGDPDEELPPAAQARLLGLDTSAITNYRKKPPPGWPDPVRVEPLPSGRTREYRTRRQLWAYHDSLTRAGAGGRPPVAELGKPDPRIEEAARALADQPGRAPGEVAAELARLHRQSVDHWKKIVTEARRSG